jgi:hypothetical protein
MVRRLRELESDGLSRLEAMEVIAGESAQRSAGVLASLGAVRGAAKSARDSGRAAGAQFAWRKEHARLDKERAGLDAALEEFVGDVIDGSAGEVTAQARAREARLRKAVGGHGSVLFFFFHLFDMPPFPNFWFSPESEIEREREENKSPGVNFHNRDPRHPTRSHV